MSKFQAMMVARAEQRPVLALVGPHTAKMRLNHTIGLRLLPRVVGEGWLREHMGDCQCCSDPHYVLVCSLNKRILIHTYQTTSRRLTKPSTG